MKVLVTGGCGFLGSNLAAHALSIGRDVAVFDNLSRAGSATNLAWLSSKGNVRFYHGDIRAKDDIENAIRASTPDCIFHLAGQVAMTTSINQPSIDFDINTHGTVNVLESVRNHAPNCVLVYSSTNKVYGDLDQYTYRETATRYQCLEKPTGFDESTPLSFHSPYGCSKGAADQYVLDYARIYGIRGIVLRHSSMFGGRQYSTYDQGWIGWFCSKALECKQGLLPNGFEISGTGKQVRDVLYADDMVRLYFLMASHADSVAGNAFNVGGGIENSLSLLELFSLLENELDVRLSISHLPPRQSDQKFFVADTSKVREAVGWHPEISALSGVQRMLDWLRSDNSTARL